MTKIIYIIPYFAESIDVSDFDLSIDFYDFEQNADTEEYFCRFPEYNRYMGYNQSIIFIVVQLLFINIFNVMAIMIKINSYFLFEPLNLVKYKENATEKSILQRYCQPSYLLIYILIFFFAKKR